VKRFFRRFIAVGQKSEGSLGGQGFNYWLEVCCPFQMEREACLKALDQVCAEIDHKALGIDVDLAVTPTSVNLVGWIADQMRARLSTTVDVRLERGDGWITQKIAGSGPNY